MVQMAGGRGKKFLIKNKLQPDFTGKREIADFHGLGLLQFYRQT